jgi:hypothetical protein
VTNLTVAKRLALAVAFALSLAAIARAQGAGAALISGGGSSHVVSASVMVAYHVHPGTDGADVLDLLVLFRGSPAWFNRTGRSGILSGGKSSTGTGHTVVSYWAQAGGITATFETDAELPTVHLSVASSTGTFFDRQIVPSETNVVLVDGVDGGQPMATTQLIDPRLERNGDAVASVMKRSPALFEFLRCDAGVPDSLTATATPDTPILGLRAMTPSVCNEMRPR